jgi:hypothetical protein
VTLSLGVLLRETEGVPCFAAIHADVGPRLPVGGRRASA